MTGDLGQTAITSFTGEYGWLSNFGPGEAEYDGVVYPTREHAFNAAKTLDPGQRARVRSQPTPGAAKSVGRSVDLRPGWDKRVRYDVMDEVLRSAFTGTELGEQLVATHDALLVEGNIHHDQHWGDCECDTHAEIPGRNHLGLQLMDLRADLRGDPLDRWTRVAVSGHRKLTHPQFSWAGHQLREVLIYLAENHDTTRVLTGVARGTDLLAAEVAMNLDLHHWAYRPYDDQSDRFHEADRKRYSAVVDASERVVTLGTIPAAAGSEARVRDLLLNRNLLLLRDAELLIAVLDQSINHGGTRHAVKHAHDQGLVTIIIDPVAQQVRWPPEVKESESD